MDSPIKTLILQIVVTLSMLFVASVSAQDVAYSKPAGFVIQTLQPGRLNLIGLTLHEPVLFSGSFDTVNGTTLRDENTDFGEILVEGNSYILEIVDNPSDVTLNGVMQVITQWTGNNIISPDDLAVDNLGVGASYQLRSPKTISDVFGTSNSAGLTAGANIASADVIWLHNGVGFEKFYYSEGGGFGGGEAGWKNDSGQDSGDYPIIYTDAMIIQSRASLEKKLVIAGVIKTKSITLALLEGKFNFISTTYPVGATLGNSGLEDDLVSNVDIEASDVIWMPDGDGGYNKYFFSPDGWKNSEGDPASDTKLSSGIVIERVGVAANAKLTPPLIYKNL